MHYDVKIVVKRFEPTTCGSKSECATHYCTGPHFSVYRSYCRKRCCLMFTNLESEDISDITSFISESSTLVLFYFLTVKKSDCGKACLMHNLYYGTSLSTHTHTHTQSLTHTHTQRVDSRRAVPCRAEAHVWWSFTHRKCRLQKCNWSQNI